MDVTTVGIIHMIFRLGWTHHLYRGETSCVNTVGDHSDNERDFLPAIPNKREIMSQHFGNLLKHLVL